MISYFSKVFRLFLYKNWKIFFFINNFLTIIYYYIIKANFIHISYYNSFYKLFNIPYVVTIYDLTHEKTKRNTQNFDKAKVLFNAKKIFCISENTKKDLINIYKINSKKIIVTPLGVDQKTYYVKNKEKYILFVGSRSKYKNLKNLFVAFSKSFFLKKNYKLIIFSEERPKKNEVNLINKLKINENVLFKSGDDHELKKNFMKASLFVFPSKYEGFGLPILEAMRFGCPVACSNINVFKEVGGKSCFYFDPFKPKKIKNVLEKALKSSNSRNTKINEGFLHIKKFKWKKCASITYQEYKKII